MWFVDDGAVVYWMIFDCTFCFMGCVCFSSFYHGYDVYWHIHSEHVCYEASEKDHYAYHGSLGNNSCKKMPMLLYFEILKKNLTNVRRFKGITL